jgi:hypothetical protein
LTAPITARQISAEAEDAAMSIVQESTEAPGCASSRWRGVLRGHRGQPGRQPRHRSHVSAMHASIQPRTVAEERPAQQLQQQQLLLLHRSCGSGSALGSRKPV